MERAKETTIKNYGSAGADAESLAGAEVGFPLYLFCFCFVSVMTAHDKKCYAEEVRSMKILSALSVLLGRNGSYTDMIQGVSILSMIPWAMTADL